MTTGNAVIDRVSGWRWVRALDDALRGNRAFFLLVGLYIGGSAIARYAIGHGGTVGTLFWLSRSTIMFAYYVVVSVVVERLRHRDAPARTAYGDAWRELRRRRLSNRRLVIGYMVLVAIAFLFSTFTWWKVRIPLVHPFDWDARLARWDAALHGGRQPWEWLQPVLGHHVITRWIDKGYSSVWSAAVALSVVWYAFADVSAKRTQFLVTFVLAWPLIGNVAASMLSSAGPCYYHLVVGGPSPYAGLLAYLRGTGVAAVGYQDMLWAIYTGTDKETVGSGISAMPSLHIATSTLIALATWTTRVRVAGAALLIFMLVGSVHLGWHYAVDGYVAIGMSIVLWFAVGAIVQRHWSQGHGSNESE